MCRLQSNSKSVCVSRKHFTREGLIFYNLGIKVLELLCVGRRATAWTVSLQTVLYGKGAEGRGKKCSLPTWKAQMPIIMSKFPCKRSITVVISSNSDELCLAHLSRCSLKNTRLYQARFLPLQTSYPNWPNKSTTCTVSSQKQDHLFASKMN